MAGRRTAPSEATEETTTTRTKREPEPGDMVDIGEAAATGEHAYAGERSEEVDDDRADEEKPGTAAHLGDSPYAGGLDG